MAVAVVVLVVAVVVAVVVAALWCLGAAMLRQMGARSHMIAAWHRLVSLSPCHAQYLTNQLDPSVRIRLCRLCRLLPERVDPKLQLHLGAHQQVQQ